LSLKALLQSPHYSWPAMTNANVHLLPHLLILLVSVS